MLSMLLIIVVCAVNFAIGFGLAVRMGHGPLALVQKFSGKPQAAAAAQEAAHSAEAAHSK
jgi:hypothetical protein